MAVTAVTTVADLEGLQASKGPGTLVVVFFWAEFHEPSRSGGQMDALFTSLAGANPGVLFAKASAEDADDLADQFDISAVPTFVFLRGKALLEKLQGADPAQLAALVAKHAASKTHTFAPGAGVSKKVALEERLRKLINAEHVMLFMKGTPDAPKCKFSRATVALLKEQAPTLAYGSFDILSDDDVRQGLKTFSSWPTYPQLYVGGKLLGGLDILKELAEEDELVEALAPRPAAAPGAGHRAAAPPAEPEPASKDVLQALVTREPVMLFMKGTPAAPRCGFSSKIVEILNGVDGLKYGTFDILSDPAVRSGLKLHFDWPTFPQLYVDGELKGGLDVVKELQEDGELRSELGL